MTDAEAGHTEDESRGPQAVQTSARLVLVAGILAGVGNLVFTPVFGPEQFMLASDVYLTAAEALRSGTDIYAATPPDRPGYRYIYPPIVVLVFLPHALLGTSAAAFAIQTVLNVAAGVGLGVLCARVLARRGVVLTRLDRLLLVGFALVSSYSAITVVNGQVTLWLAFAFAVGFDALDRDRGGVAGTAFALAALVKVFPAAIGLWLVRTRSWRALLAAVTTGLLGLGLGVAVLDPDLTVTYFTEVLTGRYDGFDGPPDPAQSRGGAQRQIATLLGVGPPWLTPLAALCLGPVVVTLYRRVDTGIERQAAILGTIVATLLFFPLQRLYLSLCIVPLVTLLYVLGEGRARQVLLAGTLVSFLRIEHEVVVAVIETLALPTAVSEAMLVAVEWLFQFVLPTTLGLWLVLIACLLVGFESPDR